MAAFCRMFLMSSSPLVDYFRCPEALVQLDTAGQLSSKSGYFAFGDAVCYGRLSSHAPADHVEQKLVDVFGSVQLNGDHVGLPFDLSEVTTNLREEQYQQNGYNILNRVTSGSAAQRVYYFLRPMLRVGIRKHLQKIRLSNWESITFPRWPVDVSVDELMRRTLGLAIKQSGAACVPFIWFWPQGADCALMLTHDVEGPIGVAFCDRLMDLDDSYGLKSAFQLIPQGYEEEWQAVARRLRSRGFEANLHDLNHDGHLFSNRAEFLHRARQINRYAREFQCEGFRAGAMYREQAWYDAFEFSYDMSVPNVAHLEPQRGGCCTVMPYFVGKILELPLTTIQDYSIFHILDDYSISLWKQQIDTIRAHNGLITFLTHPDYLTAPAAFDVYRELLQHLKRFRAESHVWAALPAEVNRWWRNRQRMTIVRDGTSWRIEGPDSGRARLAFATMRGDRVVYTFDSIDGASDGM
jgi:hypothetical protein